VDFSWITLLLQDAAGLEYRTPKGVWTPVPPVPGTLVVNLGEILEFATGGYYRATPHRVINHGGSRYSLPFFLNPSLDRVVQADAPEHVHRVFSMARESAFRFGEEEWKRKGLGIYCESCFEAKSTRSSISK
jgi:isopenicillin N synthase-like dioxygenase